MANFSTPAQEWEQFLPENSPLVGARKARVVTPSDAVDLSPFSRYIYSNDGGNINILFADDDGVTNGPVVVKFAAGEVKNIHARRIYATSTTSTVIQSWS